MKDASESVIGYASTRGKLPAIGGIADSPKSAVFEAQAQNKYDTHILHMTFFAFSKGTLSGTILFLALLQSGFVLESGGEIDVSLIGQASSMSHRLRQNGTEKEGIEMGEKGQFCPMKRGETRTGAPPLMDLRLVADFLPVNPEARIGKGKETTS
ncbi:hypothetical protein FRC18_006082 [Serendipita sp. 400]|nr:hypothetical protein FRC18_006082 [Serendipita sp. 400]